MRLQPIDADRHEKTPSFIAGVVDKGVSQPKDEPETAPIWTSADLTPRFFLLQNQPSSSTARLYEVA
jgi:hypothetical protein